jgi:bifunctional non-homologous end joining protein LigD
MKYVRIEGGSKLGEFISPMLATLSDELAFDDPKWIFEIKWDGYRAVAELKGENTKFYSRNGLSFIKAYPKVYDALLKIDRDAVIDGEVVVYDETGKPSFQSIQNYNSRQRLAIQFQVFDCLRVDGKDITRKPLTERKAILKELLPASDIIKYCDHIEGEGTVLYEHASKIGLEGIIAKKANSPYLIGKRTKDWLKIKNVFTDDFVIVGWTDPQKSRQYFGALIIARLDKGKLIHAGEVGTGFTDRLLKELYEKLKPIERKKSAMSMPIKETKEMHWVEPHFVAQVQYTEMTQDGHVRHPSFLGLRVDKSKNN